MEGIAQYHLANGLEVLLFPDDTKPVTTVNITYKVGSRQENYGETGMAHLLEHMLFKGTPSHGNLMQELGKRGMEFNGSTFFDRTNYHETFPASEENLDWALAMEADRMVNSFVARKDLDTEMTVVRNEYESGENNPRNVLWQRMQGTAYDWHNYGHPTIGARSDIENVSIERLQAYYHLYYQPDNAVLVVAGKFDPDRTLAEIQRQFGRIPKPTRVLPPLYTVEPVQDGARSVTVRRVGGTKLLAMLYHTMAGSDPDATAMDAFGEVMTVAPAGRLYKALVETRKASSVDAWFFSLHDPGTIVFWATLNEGTTLEDAQATMTATLAAIAKEPITQAELDRVKSKADKAFEDTINDPSRLGIALSEAIATGDWRLFFLQRDQWRKLTVADVQRVAQTWLKASNLTVGHYVPDAQPDRVPAARTVDVQALVKDYKGESAVSAGEAFDPTPTNLEARTQRYTLANGMKVALLPKKTRGQTVQVELSLHFGNEKTLFGRYPDGGLTGAMLMRGTKRHSRQEIQDLLDKLRAKLNAGGSETGASAGAQTRRDTLPDTLRLMAEVLREPAFPASEFEQLRQARLTSLEQARSEPQAIASRSLQRHRNPYPPGDPRYTPDVRRRNCGHQGRKPRQAAALLRRVLRRRPRRDRGGRRLRSGRHQAHAGGALRRLESRGSVHAGAAAVRGQQAGHDRARDARQGERRRPRRVLHAGERRQPGLPCAAGDELHAGRVDRFAPAQPAAPEGRRELFRRLVHAGQLVRAEQHPRRVCHLRAAEPGEGARGHARRARARRRATGSRTRRCRRRKRASCRNAGSRARRIRASPAHSPSSSTSGARSSAARRWMPPSRR